MNSLLFLIPAYFLAYIPVKILLDICWFLILQSCNNAKLLPSLLSGVKYPLPYKSLLPYTTLNYPFGVGPFVASAEVLMSTPKVHTDPKKIAAPSTAASSSLRVQAPVAGAQIPAGVVQLMAAAPQQRTPQQMAPADICYLQRTTGNRGWRRCLAGQRRRRQMGHKQHMRHRHQIRPMRRARHPGEFGSGGR